MNALMHFFLPSAQTMPNLSPQEQQLLAQLTDIQLPEPIGWWPPSAISLIVIALVLAALISGACVFFQHAKKNRYRKIAQRHFISILANREQLSSDALFLEINTLVKRCCITAIPNSKSHVASLWGADFFSFLLSTVKAEKKLDNEHTQNDIQTWHHVQYAKPESSETIQPALDRYLKFMEYWIAHHKHTLIRDTISVPGRHTRVNP